jgi:hypothetical protein
MAHYFKYAIVKLAPDDARDERINVGAVILRDDGPDVRIAKRLDKVRAISGAIEPEILRGVIAKLADFGDAFLKQSANNPTELAFSRFGLLSFSKLGQFSAQDSEAYERRVQAILKAFVEPELYLKEHKPKRSRLLTEVKKSFRNHRVLAGKGEGLESHRIVSSYALDDGLVADLVLKNGSMHVVETLDASGEQHKLIGDIGTAALVLGFARVKFGVEGVTARMIYNATPSLERMASSSLEVIATQGAELINWASSADREKLIHDLASLAVPQPEVIRRRANRRF